METCHSRRPQAPKSAVVPLTELGPDPAHHVPNPSRAHQSLFLDQAAAEIQSWLVEGEYNEIGEV